MISLALASCSPEQGAPSPAPSAPPPRAESPAEPSKPAGPIAKFTTAFSAANAQSAIVPAAKEGGYFEKYGLDVDYMYIQGSAPLAAAMVAGEVPIAYTGGSAYASAHLGGADLIAVGAPINTMIARLMALPSITSFSALRGQSIGINRPGEFSHTAVIFLLRQYGMEPDRDVALRRIGSTPEVFQAMLSGQVEAGLFTMPQNIRARKEGFVELADTAALQMPYMQTAIVTSRSYLESNPAVVLAYVKAIGDATKKFKADRAFGIRVLRQHTQEVDEEVLSETYETIIKYLEDVPYAKQEAVGTILGELALRDERAKSAKFEELVDMRFVRQLDQEGFYQKLFGK